MHPLLMLLISLISMLWAANHLVTSARCLTINLQITPFTMGLSFIAIAITLPAFIVFSSFFKSQTPLLITHVIGNNIANMALILGAAILIHPHSAQAARLKKNYPIIILSMLFIFRLILDGFLGKLDGFLFLIIPMGFISFCIYVSELKSSKDLLFKEFRKAFCATRTLNQNILSLTLGLLVLPLSTKYLILSALAMAKTGSLPPSTALPIITSIILMLPVVATALIALLQGEEGLGIGIILGANFCSLLLLFIYPLTTSLKLNNALLWRDIPIMLSLTALLLYLNTHYKHKLSSWHGGILLIIYFSYLLAASIHMPKILQNALF